VFSLPVAWYSEGRHVFMFARRERSDVESVHDVLILVYFVVWIQQLSTADAADVYRLRTGRMFHEG